MSLMIKAIRNIEDFELLEKDWETLETSTCQRNITSSFKYQLNWWKYFKDINENGNLGNCKELLILLLYDDNVLIAISPFVKLYRKKYGLKIYYIEFLAQQWSAALLDIIANKSNTDQIHFIFDWIYKNEKFDVLQLKFIPEDSRFFDIHDPDITVLNACPEICLNDFTDYANYRDITYSKSLKHKFRKILKKILKEDITYSEKIFTVFDESLFLIIMEISKSKLNDGKESIYLNSVMRDFYKTIFSLFPISVVIIYLNEKPVAYKINLYYKNMKMSIDTSYDRNYKEYFLGNFSVDCSIRDSFEKKISFHSAGPGVNENKIQFFKKLFKIHTFTKKGNTLLSYFIYRKAKSINIEKQNEYLQYIETKTSFFDQDA